MANHELISRGTESINKLAAQPIFVFGLGAIGSELINSLVRMGAKNIAGCDKDRIENDNIGSQLYGSRECGMLKADALKNRIFNDTKVKINTFKETISDKTLNKVIKNNNGALFVDCFDNTASRKLLKENLKECLHIGMAPNYAEIVWNDKYVVPDDTGMDVCNYPQTRSLVYAVVALASESIMEFVVSGKRRSVCFTLKDFRASEY
jgi:hypothetical protein